MPSSNNQDPIDAAKELLGISDNLPILDLCERLTELRNSKHPDLFQDPKLKEEAEEQFKSIGELLGTLERLAQREHLSRTSSQLAVSQPQYEIVTLKIKISQLSEQLFKTKRDLETQTQANILLHNKNKSTEDTKTKENIKDLIETYKPKKGSTLRSATAFTMTAALGVILKIDSIAPVIQKYSPFDPIIINSAVVFALASVLLFALRQHTKSKEFENLAEWVCTTSFSDGFSGWLKKSRGPNPTEFSESEAVEYITQQLASRRLLKFTNTLLQLELLTDSPIDALKNAFIYSLMGRGMINHSSTQGMSRTFTIKGTRFFDFNNLPF
ncbi:hypothetical protein HPC50_14300 [Corallococcus exiguus]|uniref:hypothetical protein n=1 Tax=Corallococcus TaxID=83461 RepID=UPI0011C4552C|nr:MULTISPECIES: hypothetical protein [Corallococcus]NPC48246.1 hypothetical protein [Corallococcus exiguus]